MTAPPRGEQPTILIVDGEANVRVLTAYLLTERAGFHVLEACNADEALTWLNANKDVQGVVTEVRIPGVIDGLALARIVRERWPHIATIVTSNWEQPKSSEIAKNAFFLPKPYNTGELIVALHDALRARHEAMDVRS